MPLIKYDKPEMANNKQIHYIECLAIDLQFERQTRNLRITDIVKRPISFLDELTKQEASKVIDKFKEWKEGKC